MWGPEGPLFQLERARQEMRQYRRSAIDLTPSIQMGKHLNIVHSLPNVIFKIRKTYAVMGKNICSDVRLIICIMFGESCRWKEKKEISISYKEISSELM